MSESCSFRMLNANFASMVLSIVVFFSRCVGPTQRSTVWFAPVLQNGVIHRSRLAPRDRAGQPRIAPRLRRLVGSRPRRIKRALAFFDNLAQRANRAPRGRRQRRIWHNFFHAIHAARGNHVLGGNVRIRLQLRWAPIVLTALIQTARPLQHGDLPASVLARQRARNIAHWNANPGPNRWHLIC